MQRTDWECPCKIELHARIGDPGACEGLHEACRPLPSGFVGVHRPHAEHDDCASRDKVLAADKTPTRRVWRRARKGCDSAQLPGRLASFSIAGKSLSAP